MKKFTKIFICLLLCVFSLGFVACGDNRTPEEKAFTYPSANDLCLSNGGLAVQKGNYIYYVNGYKTVNSGEHTQDGTYMHGALMLMKLDSYGNIVTDEDGLIKDNYYITMSDRLCGFEATNLYISGNYLYFVSPSKGNTTDNSVDPVWAKDYVEFYRIKLDKTGDVELLYQADVTYSNLDFEYYTGNGNTFILVYEAGKTLEKDGDKNNAIVRVDANSKTSNVVANNINTYTDKDSKTVGNYIFAENSNEIFFVDSEGNLKNYNVVSNSLKNYSKVEITTAVNVKFVSKHNVYVSYSDNGCTMLAVSNIATESVFEDCWIDIDSYDKIIVDNGIVMAIDDKFVNFIADEDENLLPLSVSEKFIIEEEKTINVIGCDNGGIVYYVDGDDSSTKIVKFVSYSNLLKNSSAEIQTLATVENIDTTYFDLADGYLYFFKTPKDSSHNYLFRLKVENNNEDVEEMVGVYLEADKPVVEDDENNEE